MLPPVRRVVVTGLGVIAPTGSGVEAFWWTLREFCDQQLLPYVFADADDDATAMAGDMRSPQRP